MAIEDTINTPAGATLTQKELFQRFLDAPFYEGSNLSTLVDARRVSERTVQENFHYCTGLASGHWPDLGCGWGGMHEFLLEHLRESDDPEFDLDEIVNDIAGMLRDFEELKRGFDAVCAVTRVDELDEDATAEEVREWEDNPRYVLPSDAARKRAA
ncbi:hypothetical protein [Phaeobacter gallaeciensis]|uniref:hypothetical protein n=1 Tax=Phaeobacter gallaeciensis TaxID=60890 RepID=UPI00237F2727|nr:hypothetical protein [Phaeobacter gallaeciensis]MDE4096662.1 hypothetical protein [Phaeobacter gallaeciensis]MDE4105473.1 hypothetical protein [Phaeobacter gallaeciensis]MDE4109929.1 hypothetical protein [Phaeobacter gallaeciensis]MDE4114397.1 hypothetical protein [Phaeobacter gallaeciensis]MDE4118864.1 hypothetical protein [Phaeobacter gallaeciensis]